MRQHVAPIHGDTEARQLKPCHGGGILRWCGAAREVFFSLYLPSQLSNAVWCRFCGEERAEMPVAPADRVPGDGMIAQRIDLPPLIRGP